MLMKYLFIVLVLSLCWQLKVSSQPCLPYGISFHTQESVDNFQTDYPNCTEIEGSLWIEGVDITNLLGLNVITSVQGSFYVRWDSLLTSLEGLENLSFIGESLDIRGTVLNSLTGLNNLTYIGENLSIDLGDSIASLSGIENLEYIGGDISLHHNERLTNIDALHNTSHVGGSVILAYCHSLTTLSGLPIMDTIHGSLQLLNMYGLTNVAGLDSLKYIDERLRIIYCYDLENMYNLGNLNHIGTSLIINKCNNLTSLTGLDSVIYIGGDLLIDENNSLQTLSGIDNIESESIENLSITYNPQLSTCEVQSVCEYLANPNGDIQIYVNGTGCNNSVEVTEACTVGMPEKTSDTPLTVYPNPFTTSTTIEYELTEPSHIQLTIYNAIGGVVYTAEDRLIFAGKHSFTWSPERLPEGMYYAVLRSEEGVSVVKMVKQ